MVRSPTQIDRELEAPDNKQMFENLFRNAVEHGGDDIHVTVEPLRNGIVIEDDGPGIPENHRTDMLNLGFSTNESGTSVGLHIEWQVVKAHGWDIRATEGAAGGARFEVTGIDFVDGQDDC